jgi:Protein of unknown function (DUF551)
MNWISVNEKCPVDEQEVLIFVEYEDRYKDNDITYRKIFIGYCCKEFSYNSDWNVEVKDWRIKPCACCAPMDFTVLYWMPLPKEPEINHG